MTLPLLPDLHLTGARVLRPCGLTEAPLGLADGRLVEGCPGRAVDLSGWWVLPGIVDAHGDGFERHLAPRRGALRDLGDGLAMAAAELAVNGITTAMLAQFFSWEGGMRSPDFAEAMAAAHAALAPSQAVDLRLQLRLEVSLIDAFPRAAALIDRHDIRYLVLNDHLPHAALTAGKKPPRLTGQALKSGRSPEAHLAMMQALHDRMAEVPAALAALIGARSGLLVGSHDDATPEDRQHWRALGARVSEFPETRAAAAEARADGDPVVLGAPNVVRGGSHAKKVSAAELVAEGLCTALASDYHYPAPRQAALKLASEIGIEAAWGLVSSGPAAMLGLADRGTLEAGKRADLVILDPDTGRVGATISGGRLAWLGAELAPRFIG
ncbi:alpha-D-ribose 1-methylphosphonate 5-triphosphate diphosphatase [Pseudooceanicola marinus]|uniref:alpha-D-ribose 1-methylphosphonate 5-triphosphate diphosphatase n=1 Tax=Pseudooceanicola marinus TaxID=396013 RepID=UPI001CD2123C|nr:alpha-D-ribose 1-methylphosphonate 5-triphosphate diphosphatase [Pseudooceanicola marinus]MCA1336446.1 alpha-D-ribose 1-methylphosphonate 5-triphosphate diphosphatase [Pseudooceanicola marinus]